MELSEVDKGPSGGVVGEVVEIGRNLGISWHWFFCICVFALFSYVFCLLYIFICGSVIVHIIIYTSHQHM